MADVTIGRPRPEVAVLTLDRPASLNALTFALVDDLHDALDEIGNDNTCRVVVLTGAGRGFCSGLDLANIGPSTASAGLSGPRAGMRSQQRIGDLPARLRRLQQPVIAAVNGPAFGGGFALALACDIRIASSRATFSAQFIKVGVGGGDLGMSYTLPRIIGAGRAFELLLTARTVAAAEALSFGIVTEVVDEAGGEGAVVDRALALADLLCSYSPFGVVMTKEVMWSNLDATSLDAALHLENRTQILAGTTGDVLEAAAAFIEKRPPVWGANAR